jgi:hypothetical protein
VPRAEISLIVQKLIAYPRESNEKKAISISATLVKSIIQDSKQRSNNGYGFTFFFDLTICTHAELSENRNKCVCGVEHYEEKQTCGDRGLLKGMKSNIDCRDRSVMPGKKLFEAEKQRREKFHAQKELELKLSEATTQNQSQS